MRYYACVLSDGFDSANEVSNNFVHTHIYHNWKLTFHLVDNELLIEKQQTMMNECDDLMDCNEDFSFSWGKKKTFHLCRPLLVIICMFMNEMLFERLSSSSSLKLFKMVITFYIR